MNITPLKTQLNTPINKGGNLPDSAIPAIPAIVKERKVKGAHIGNRLKTLALSKLSKGRHPDGLGLFLFVQSETSKSWTLRFSFEGKVREMSLGKYPLIELSEARTKANAARELVAKGINPIEAKHKSADMPTFGKIALDVLDRKKMIFTNPKHIYQWDMTLKTYAKPLWDMPVNKIETTHVLDILSPIWTLKPETASRLRGRIEVILNQAKTLKYREGENPAAWGGNLENLLDKRNVSSKKHHAALSYDELPDFMRELRERDSVSAKALEFTILTAARSGETRGALWKEIDMKAKLWTVPAERMKAKKEHVVPLSPDVFAILEHQLQYTDGDPQSLVFPSPSKGVVLSDMSLLNCLKHLRPDCTVHGFRSTFRDWCGDNGYSRELAEHSLAHALGDATEKAYRRNSAIEQRRPLMNDYAAHCAGIANSNVIPLRRA